MQTILDTLDSAGERRILSDGEIDVSINFVRAEAPVWWRWEGEAEFRDLGVQTADMPITDPQVIAAVRLQLDLD